MMMQAATARGPSFNRPSSTSSNERKSSAFEIETSQQPLNGQDLTIELDRLRKEKIAAIFQIEKYKKRISLAIVFALFGFAVAIGMIIWRFSPVEPTWEELRQRLMGTPEEESSMCVTVYPNAISKTFNVSETKRPLMLTPLISNGSLQEAAEAARVTNILQTVTSYSGFLTVNETTKNHLFFWFFPAQSKAASAPLIVWLQGGPGWPTMYGLFKEHGPYLVGWDATEGKPTLLNNIYSWNLNHNMLYIDNPAGTGFSFSETPKGLAKTDHQLALELLEALTQFMLLYPYLIQGAVSAQTPVYAFGESYGGSYVVSLAHVYLQQREMNNSYIRNLWIKGLGIGNGFISAEEQSLYADYVNALTFLNEAQYEKLKGHDEALLEALKAKNYSNALKNSQASLYYFVSEIMPKSNIYDFTFDENFLTNHDYVCYLQNPIVRKAIHAGDAVFNDGYAVYNELRESMMVSKKPWLSEALERGIEVLIYNGNLDVIVNVPGTNAVVNSLQWSGRGEFVNSKRKEFWVFNERTQRGELAGYVNEGGGLTMAIIRNAGHMVPISQPLWALELVTQFTHLPSTPASSRFEKPSQIKPSSGVKFYDCH